METAKDQKTIRNRDILLVAVFLAAAVAGMALFGTGIFRGASGGSTSDPDSSLTMEITCDGEVIFSEKLSSLTLPFEYAVDNDYGRNVFLAEVRSDGSVGLSCIEADCPDRICVETGVITLENELIVCLPHRLVARLY